MKAQDRWVSEIRKECVLRVEVSTTIQLTHGLVPTHDLRDMGFVINPLFKWGVRRLLREFITDIIFIMEK